MFQSSNIKSDYKNGGRWISYLFSLIFEESLQAFFLCDDILMKVVIKVLKLVELNRHMLRVIVGILLPPIENL